MASDADRDVVDMDIEGDEGGDESKEAKRKKSKSHHKEHRSSKHKKSKKSKSHRQSPDGDQDYSSSLQTDTLSEMIEGNGGGGEKGNQMAAKSGLSSQTFDDSGPSTSTFTSKSQQETSMEDVSAMVTGGGRVEEMSIEETNKVRAKLGLKPLTVGKDAASTKQEDVHAPPVNLSQVKATEKIKEKISVQKERRQLEKKLKKVKGLGDARDEEEESVDAWVQKSRLLQEERRKADERSKLLDQYDEDQDAAPVVTRARYSAHDLTGLKVEHDLDKFDEGREIILTLKDTEILKDDQGDVLVSTTLNEEEKNRRNVENRKKKADYNPYENVEDNMGGSDEYGQTKLLSKYNETIAGEDRRKKNFVLGQNQEDERVKRMQAARPGVNIEQLISSPSVLARDYYNEQEMATFKKPRRLKKPIKQEDTARPRSRIVDDDDVSVPAPSSSVSRNFVVEDDFDLQSALNQTRRIKQLQQHSLVKSESQDFLQDLVAENSSSMTSSAVTFMDDTSEFCRTIRTGAPLVSRVKEEVVPIKHDEDSSEAEDLDMDTEDGVPNNQQSNQSTEGGQRGGWSEVQFEAEAANLGGSDEEEEELSGGGAKRKKSRRHKSASGSGRADYKSVLGNELSMERGVASALKLANQKGLIDQTGVVKSYAPLPTGKPSSIPQQEYIVDDNKIMDDDKRSRHDRYAGPLVSFRDKPGYKPGFRLEYHDATGRQLNAKEAFRDLSHKFHGKGPGKLKTERRTKKYLEEKLMREMSSIDTPLRTVEKMKQKQAEAQLPFILLSGAQAKTGPTPISKR